MTLAPERFRKITDYGVIPASSAADAARSRPALVQGAGTPMRSTAPLLTASTVTSCTTPGFTATTITPTHQAEPGLHSAIQATIQKSITATGLAGARPAVTP